MPFVTQKSTRSGSLFLSYGQYVGSPIVLSSLRPRGVMSLDSPVDMLGIVVSSCSELTPQGIIKVF
jgi:hypothetical protein